MDTLRVQCLVSLTSTLLGQRFYPQEKRHNYIPDFDQLFASFIDAVKSLEVALCRHKFQQTTSFVCIHDVYDRVFVEYFLEES